MEALDRVRACAEQLPDQMNRDCTVALVFERGTLEFVKNQMTTLVLQHAPVAHKRSLFRKSLEEARSFDGRDVLRPGTLRIASLLSWTIQQSKQDLTPLAGECEEILAWHLDPAQAGMRDYRAIQQALLLYPLPPKAASRFVIEYVLGAYGKFVFLGNPLIDLVQPPDLQRLRTMLADAVEGRTSNTATAFVCLTVLADVGDEQALPWIEAARRMRPAGWTDELLDSFVSAIELQHPPARLLAVAERPLDSLPASFRRWALERALELGIDRHEVTAAIHRYAAVVQPRIDEMRRLKGERAARLAAAAYFGPVRSLGIRHGLLLEAEHPEAKDPLEGIEE